MSIRTGATGLPPPPAAVDTKAPAGRVEPTRVETTGVPSEATPKPVGDGVDAQRGTAKVAGQEQLAKGEAVGREVLAQLESLTRAMGPMGAQRAERGDIDVDAKAGTWLTPGSQQARIGAQVGAVMKGDDLALQGDLCRVLGASVSALEVAQQASARELPEGARSTRAAQLGRVVDLALRDLNPRTAKIWEKTGQALAHLATRGGELTGRPPRLGVENPFFDGTAAYGNATNMQWYKPGQYELWGFDKAVADAVLQGNLGDCYLLSALASIALKKPEILQNMIRKASNGNYVVSFYAIEPFQDANGNWDVRVKQPPKKVDIEVSPEVLVDGEGYVVGAGVTDKDGDQSFEIGINLIEKAFAMYNDQLREQYPDFVVFGSEGQKGYNGIEGGFADWVLETISGEESGWDEIPLTQTPGATLLDVVSAANSGSPVIMGSLGEAEAQALLDAGVWPNNLVPGHAYSAVGTCQVDGETYVVLRNPWGCVEPAGNPPDDGVFMMKLADAEKCFGTVFFDQDAPALGKSIGPAEFTSVASALQSYVDVVTRGAAQTDSVVPNLDVVTIANDVAGNMSDSIQGRWSDFCGQMALGGGMDVNALVQWVLRESYLETTKDLQFYAEKVRFFNDLKKKIREEVTRMRQQLGGLAGKADDYSLNPPIVPREFDDNYYGKPAEATQDPAALAEYQTRLDAEKAAREQEIKDAIAQYEGDCSACTDTKTVPVPGWTDPGEADAGQVNSYGSSYGQSMVEWWNSLTPDQQAAAREYLEEHGLEFKCKIRDDNGWDKTTNTKNVTIPPLEPGQDVEEYLMNAGLSAGNVLAEFKRAGSSINKVDINLVSGPWGQDLSVPDYSKVPMPEILQEIGYQRGEGYKAGMGERGAGYNEAPEWQEGDPVTTKEGLEKYIENLEEKLNSVGDDAQLANVDLQNVLQKQQQTLQMMSNISKMLHDTAMSIIRKIGG